MSLLESNRFSEVTVSKTRVLRSWDLPTIIALLFTVFLLTGCGMNTEEAREKLADLNVDYKAENFVQHAVDGDQMVVDLFLVAGMDPNTQAAVRIPADQFFPNYLLDEIGARGLESFREEGGILFTKATPLFGATSYGNAKLVRRLLDAGADWNINPNTGLNISIVGNSIDSYSPFDLAVMRGHAEIVEIYLEAGINSNKSFSTTKLPVLMIAVEFNNKNVVQTLLDAGAKPNPEGDMGTSALNLAKSRNFSDIANMLREAGATE
jgi:hypothetical protein